MSLELKYSIDTSALTIAACVAAIALIVVAICCMRLRHRSKRLSEKIRRLPSYESAVTNDGRKEAAYARNEHFSVDIISDLETCFTNRYITFAQEKEFTRYYTDYFST